MVTSFHVPLYAKRLRACPRQGPFDSAARIIKRSFADCVHHATLLSWSQPILLSSQRPPDAQLKSMSPRGRDPRSPQFSPFSLVPASASPSRVTSGQASRRSHSHPWRHWLIIGPIKAAKRTLRTDTTFSFSSPVASSCGSRVAGSSPPPIHVHLVSQRGKRIGNRGPAHLVAASKARNNHLTTSKSSLTTAK